ncbi:hypothetical protein FC72_GL000496 [Companilactobacillus tucceti DSM 20183]|uniref:Uncharacterized protein n=1 Tax=Companilactobacillus tucceti DSM 20183 TaxID=1423811 RepID=A0A0R1J8L3_9LACO|nr:hypothetical protein [Companilactobacillus tucceti]KRK64330.1 hypothetical protein FC72_GL000496 [Companilactobacillus tucceti DSM 20183]
MKLAIETIIFDAMFTAIFSSVATYLFIKFKTLKGILKNTTDFYGFEKEDTAGNENFRTNIYSKTKK